MILKCKADMLATFLIVVLFSVVTNQTQAKEQITIGRIEDVILLPWGIKLPARIDTGATTSSLDARNLRIQGEIAEFELREKYGGVKFQAPIVDWRHIRSPKMRQKRPVIELEVCVGPRRLRIRVNLADRSMVKYPLILGRNVLRQDFIVDVRRSRLAPPKCPHQPPLPASN